MSDWGFLNRHRVRNGPFGSNDDDGFNGMFTFPLAGEARKICVISSDDMGWRHVSVSFGKGSKRTPSWDVMSKVKELFWGDEDVVVQFHPAKAEYVNNHPGCLHLWQCTDGREQPTPPSLMVGIKTLGVIT